MSGLAGRTRRIPPILHYCWYGGNPVSEEMERCLESWRRHLPGFRVIRWDETNIPDDPFVTRALAAGRWSRASNAVRAHALLGHGGLYLDTDVEVLRSFEPLRGFPCFMAFQYEPDGTPYKPFEMCVNTAVLGARPGHPFIRALLNRIPRHLEGLEAFDVMGPSMATAVAIDFGLRAYSPTGITIGGARVLPKETFYPYFYQEEPQETFGPETFAIHLWAKRW